MNRQCGGCTLCCKLLPVRELDKPGGKKCQYQSHAKGCTVYKQAPMPVSCRLWSCRWLYQEDTAGLSRPDRAHYVLDIMPDYITARDDESGRQVDIEVIQIWVDPLYPHAHRDPALRLYLDGIARTRGAMALIRYDSKRSFVLLPPSMNSSGEWVEHAGQIAESDHSAEDILAATGRLFG